MSNGHGLQLLMKSPVLLGRACGQVRDVPSARRVSREAGEPLLFALYENTFQNKKTRHMAGFIVDTHETRATAYPAECRYNGRRARDVMPAAMRALVRTLAV
jgi:hypothetical protein